MPLVPVTRITTAQNVADQIIEMLRSGELVAGDKLPSERELMEMLDVGRSSIREALQSLAMLNMIEIIPGVGTVVKEPDTSELLRADVIGFLIRESMARELLEAREMIEPASVRLACLRATDSDLQEIDGLLDRHAALLAAEQPTNEISARFHIRLAEAAHNHVVIRFMESILELLMQRARKAEHTTAYAAYAVQELQEHRAIFERVRDRDADQAAELLLRHIVHSAATYDATGIA